MNIRGKVSELFVIAGMLAGGIVSAPVAFGGEIVTSGGYAAEGEEVIAPYDNGVYGYEIIRDFFTDSGREIVKIWGLTQKNISEITDIVVPDEIECEGVNYPVGVIGVNVFADLDNLRSVTLPPSVVCVEPNFINCQRLEEVILPEGLQGLEIGGSFSDCPALRSLTVPTSAGWIGSLSINSCGIKTLTFCGNVSLEASSVSGLWELETLNFGGSVFVWEYCLSALTKLRSISLKGSDMRIMPKYVLSWCEALEDVYLSDAEELKIESTVLTFCPSLRRIYVPQAVPPVIWGRDMNAEFGGTTGAEGSIDKETCVLYVPEGAVEAYRADPAWNAFTHIVEYDFASESVINADSLTEYDGPEEYYDLGGRRVDAPSGGVFIRRQGSNVVKVSVP